MEGLANLGTGQSRYPRIQGRLDHHSAEHLALFRIDRTQQSRLPPAAGDGEREDECHSDQNRYHGEDHEEHVQELYRGCRGVLQRPDIIGSVDDFGIGQRRHCH